MIQLLEGIKLLLAIAINKIKIIMSGYNLFLEDHGTLEEGEDRGFPTEYPSKDMSTQNVLSTLAIIFIVAASVFVSLVICVVSLKVFCPPTDARTGPHGGIRMPTAELIDDREGGQGYLD